MGYCRNNREQIRKGLYFIILSVGYKGDLLLYNKIINRFCRDA